MPVPSRHCPGDLLRIGVRFQTGATGVVQVHPGGEVLRAKLRERQQQIGDVALGINDDRGNAVQRRLFQQRDAQTRLATARHAQHDRVRGQVARVVVDHLVGGALRGGINTTTQVESCGSFDKRHGRPQVRSWEPGVIGFQSSAFGAKGRPSLMIITRMQPSTTPWRIWAGVRRVFSPSARRSESLTASDTTDRVGNRSPPAHRRAAAGACADRCESGGPGRSKSDRWASGSENSPAP